MRIVIVGAGDGFDLIRDYENEADLEIWAVASIYPVLQSYNIARVFEMHKPEKWQPINYTELGAKLTLPYQIEGCPNASFFPISALEPKYGVMFSSSISWMVAEALEQPGVTEIILLGVDMEGHSEYSKQRDGLFFILGFARAYGITITIPETSKINIFGQQYGH